MALQTRKVKVTLADATGAPIVGKQVFVQLTQTISDGVSETFYPTQLEYVSDSDGLVETAELACNDDPDASPRGTAYMWTGLPGTATQFYIVSVDDPDPVDLASKQPASPTQPYYT